MGDNGMDNQDRNRSKYMLAFLSLCETLSRDGYIGAILVTDERGIPQEFRCTYPVKPTMIQRVLLYKKYYRGEDAGYP